MALLAMPIVGVFAFLGRFQQGLGAWVCLATVLIVARYRWSLRKNIWFWVAIIIMLLSQIPIIMYVPWNARGLNGRALIPLGIADGAVGLSLVKIAEAVIKHTGKSDDGNLSS